MSFLVGHTKDECYHCFSGDGKSATIYDGPDIATSTKCTYVSIVKRTGNTHFAIQDNQLWILGKRQIMQVRTVTKPL